MVSKLMIKTRHSGNMNAVDCLSLSREQGIVRGVHCSPYRQVLINDEATLGKFMLLPGDLFENIILKDVSINALPSGTVIRVGDTLIRLTFHCEPCFKIKDKVKLSAILHQRGYLGQVMNTGTIYINDHLDITTERMEPIPYDPIERICWYLRKQNQPIYASSLVWNIGLAASYCRALPAIIRKHKNIDPAMILFKKNLK